MARTGKQHQILLQCGDHFENQRRVALLTQALQALGHKPIVMLYSHGHGDIFRRMGVETVFLNDYLDRVRPSRRLKDKTPIVRGISTQELIEVEGRRRPMITWPGQLKKTRQDAQRYLQAIEQLLTEVEPDRVAVWNGFTGYAANSLRLICGRRGIETAFMERGLRPDSLFIDHSGVNGASSLLDFDASAHPEPTSADRFELQQSFPALSETTDRQSVTHQFFFPLQVERDTNILLYSPFPSMRSAFLSAYNLFDGVESQFVVRPHPEEVAGHRLNIPRFDNVSIDAQSDLAAQVAKADLIITINSTVGLEALIQGKPVCALGQSIYSAICANPAQATCIDDYRVAPETLHKYLIALSRDNLLIDGKSSNLAATMKQLSLPNLKPTAPPVRAVSLSQISEIMHRRDSRREIVVDMDANPGKTLNLTYRKNQQSLDLFTLKQQLFPDLDPAMIKVRRKAGAGPRGDILVVDEGWSGPVNPYLAVVNCYGVVLKSAKESE